MSMPRGFGCAGMRLARDDGLEGLTNDSDGVVILLLVGSGSAEECTELVDRR